MYNSINHGLRSVLSSIAVAAVLAGGAVALDQAEAATSWSPVVNQSQTVNEPVACHDLWLNDHTVGDEDRCRANGWQVTWRYVLSPDTERIWTGYKPCPTEDSHRCYWNARVQGNGHGHSFVQAGHAGTFYVTRINGHRA